MFLLRQFLAYFADNKISLICATRTLHAQSAPVSGAKPFSTLFACVAIIRPMSSEDLKTMVQNAREIRLICPELAQNIEDALVWKLLLK